MDGYIFKVFKLLLYLTVISKKVIAEEKQESDSVVTHTEYNNLKSQLEEVTHQLSTILDQYRLQQHENKRLDSEVKQLKTEMKQQLDEAKNCFKSEMESLKSQLQEQILSNEQLLKTQFKKYTKKQQGIDDVFEDDTFANHQSSGQALSPLHDNFSVVSFTAYATETREYATVGEILLFDAALTNYGDAYQPDLSTFVCPENGYYIFLVHTAESNLWAEIHINYENPLLAGQTGIHGGGQGSTSVVTLCPQGNFVTVRTTREGASMYGDPTFRVSTFSGTLLFPVNLDHHRNIII